MKLSKSLKLALRAIVLKAGEMETDKGKLIYDADELAVGVEVFVEKADEEGNIEYVPAEDGEYAVEEQIYVVAEGKIAEIKDAEKPVDEEPAAEPETEVAAAEEVDPNAPAAEDIEKPEVEQAQTPEERIDSLENRFAEFVEGIEKVLNAISAIDERVAAIENKLAEMEKPAAEPIDETPAEEEMEHKSKLSYLRKK